MTPYRGIYCLLKNLWHLKCEMGHGLDFGMKQKKSKTKVSCLIPYQNWVVFCADCSENAIGEAKINRPKVWKVAWKWKRWLSRLINIARFPCFSAYTNDGKPEQKWALIIQFLLIAMSHNVPPQIFRLIYPAWFDSQARIENSARERRKYFPFFVTPRLLNPGKSESCRANETWGTGSYSQAGSKCCTISFFRFELFTLHSGTENCFNATMLYSRVGLRIKKTTLIKTEENGS